MNGHKLSVISLINSKLCLKVCGVSIVQKGDCSLGIFVYRVFSWFNKQIVTCTSVFVLMLSWNQKQLMVVIIWALELWDLWLGLFKSQPEVLTKNKCSRMFFFLPV